MMLYRWFPALRRWKINRLKKRLRRELWTKPPDADTVASMKAWLNDFVQNRPKG